MKVKDIYELIDVISTRTPMYVGEWKLSNVRSFLDGYIFSLNGGDEGQLKEFWSDFPGFFDWVAKKYGFYESTAGWQNMILAVEMNLPVKGIKWDEYAGEATKEQHKKSVLKFFELVKEYKESL